MPSCTVAEQVSVRGCPATTGLMEWTMPTVGGKGAVEELNGLRVVCESEKVSNYSNLHNTVTETVSSPSSLAVTKVCTLAGGLARALQVKLVLSNVLRGDNMRLLVNGCWEPERGEMVTLSSLLDKGAEPFSQVMSMSVTDMVVSVAEFMEMVQVRVRGVVLPAYRGPGGTVILMLGVETGERKKFNIKCVKRKFF